jgi:hypothetical protein
LLQLYPEDFVARLAGFRGWRECGFFNMFHRSLVPERKVSLFKLLFSFPESISKILIVFGIPYHRKRFPEDITETHLFHRVSLAAENPFERRGERGIEIDARRNFSLCGYVKVP